MVYVHIDYDDQEISFGYEYDLIPPRKGLSTTMILILIWGSIGLAIGGLCWYQKRVKQEKLRKELV